MRSLKHSLGRRRKPAYQNRLRHAEHDVARFHSYVVAGPDDDSCSLWRGAIGRIPIAPTDRNDLHANVSEHRTLGER